MSPSDSVQMERLLRQRESLREVIETISAELELGPLLDGILHQACKLLEADDGSIGLYDEVAGEMVTMASYGLPEGELGMRVPPGVGLAGLMLQKRQPMLLERYGEVPNPVWPEVAHHAVVSVPIERRDRFIGFIGLGARPPRVFDQGDVEALALFARHATIAIENARLYAQEARVATLEERNRIRMDLHDGVMQQLYGVGLLLEDVAERLDEEPERSKNQIWRSIDRLNAAIADLRGYVIGLKPLEAANQPLEESLTLLAEQARSNALLEVDVDIRSGAAQRLDRPRAEAIYYIAADALGNIARHARARRASLRFFDENGVVVLEIGDDGVGFDYEAAVSGHGLGNMRERAFAVGGTLRVESRPGHGARVRLELPTAKEMR